MPCAHALADNDRANNRAEGYIELLKLADQHCAKQGGKRMHVKSTHPTRTIRVQLKRYFMGVGQAGRSVLILEPNGKPQPLGCTRVLDAPQTWKLITATFVENNYK